MSNFILCPILNGLSMTKALLPDLLCQDIGNVEVLFLSNGCIDGSVEWLSWMAKQDRRIHVVNVPPPHGVARAWNHGLNWCFENGEEYVLVLNNDIRLHKSTYRWLVEDGGLFVTAVGVRDPNKIIGLTNPDPTAKRPHPDFSCYLIRRECWKTIGPFYEMFTPAFFEDNDYHCRMHQAGITAFCLDLPFLHYGSQTIKNCDEEKAEDIKRAAQKNSKYFKKKWGFEAGSKEYYDFFGTTAPPEADSIGPA